jgi:cytochrome c oxidase assembly factor CtaG
MTTWQALTTTWTPEPTVMAGCVALLAGYLVILPREDDTPLPSGKLIRFGCAVGALAFALQSPLDLLGDRYLFSVHMVQHLILLLIVPPLLLFGLPEATIARLLAHAPVRATERYLGHPVVAGLLGIGMMWVWHLPRLYDAALASTTVHIVEHLCFLATSTIYWWPVIVKQASRALSTGGAIAYLLLGMAASSILGMIITLAPEVLYTPYLHPIDRLGILPLIRAQWGIAPLMDQQIGGLLMWVPGSAVYMLALIYVLARWYRQPEAPEDLPLAMMPPPVNG